MTTYRRIASGLGLLAASATIAAVGAAPLLVSGADHLDAPTTKANHRIDITDLYAFKSKGGTTLILNVNPLTSPADTKTARFDTGALYEINVDTNVDGLTDVVYRIKFGSTRTNVERRRHPELHHPPRRPAPRPGQCLGRSRRRHRHHDRLRRLALASPRSVGGGKAFAGPRDDPFFFDLPGFVEFKKQLLAGSTDLGVLLGGFTGVDTFKGTNVSTIAIEVPNARLGGTGKTIGVWATTSVKSGGGYQQVERMGRPAINTVFNNTSAEKEAANRLRPRDDRALDKANVIGVLDAIGHVLDVNGAPSYTTAQKNGIANVLLPDELTVKLGDSAGFLNGRRPADDVIDAEFGLLTNGAVHSDGVNANDRAFPTSFPYLARPN